MLHVKAENKCSFQPSKEAARTKSKIQMSNKNIQNQHAQPKRAPQNSVVTNYK